MSFKLNYKYYLYTFYKDNINSYSKFNFTNKLIIEFQNLIAIYKKNFYYIEELQK